jgi:hypothetical protein
LWSCLTSRCGCRQGGAFDGEYDEGEARASFQEAVMEWRRGGKSSGEGYDDGDDDDEDDHVDDKPEKMMTMLMGLTLMSLS